MEREVGKVLNDSQVRMYIEEYLEKREKKPRRTLDGKDVGNDLAGTTLDPFISKPQFGSSLCLSLYVLVFSC
ncbi:hypothetical protein Y1Q_0015624 [Alligator mississippiensis]|uniref:Uncharacterized protein n=1 Tax=Alligator mississippiensis TaxID=8496 RepID=A0A151NNH0_ALLMI|nr:hypothetical protein Y1Q_0015624 [Alligator mississippiensis]